MIVKVLSSGAFSIITVFRSLVTIIGLFGGVTLQVIGPLNFIFMANFANRYPYDISHLLGTDPGYMYLTITFSSFPAEIMCNQ